MKLSPIHIVCFAAFACGLLTSPTRAAEESNPVLEAAAKLKASGGYRWKTEREGSRFWQGVVEGAVDKDGIILVKQPGMDGHFHMAFRDGKSAAETGEGWRSAEDFESEEGFGRFMGFMLRRFRAPAEEIEHVASNMKSMLHKDGAYEGEITEKAVAEMLSFGGGNGPEVQAPSGKLSVTVSEGGITGYTLRLQGEMSFNGNDIEIDRVSKVTFSDVGSATVELPEGALAKLK